MADALDNALHTHEGLTCTGVVLVLVGVNSETESLDKLPDDVIIGGIISDSLEELHSMVLIHIHEEIGDLVLERLILSGIAALVYYVVYYKLTHSNFHAFSFSIRIPGVVLPCCLFEKILLVAPLVGL